MLDFPLQLTTKIGACGGLFWRRELLFIDYYLRNKKKNTLVLLQKVSFSKMFDPPFLHLFVQCKVTRKLHAQGLAVVDGK